MLRAPSATDLPEEHADWLELKALSVRDRSSSAQDLVAALRPTGTLEEAGGRRLGAEAAERIADAAFSEVGDRARSCAGGYPFVVHQGSLQATETAMSWFYTHLLLLSAYGHRAVDSEFDALAHFDNLAGRAGSEYLGGASAGAGYFIFGFPRRVAPSGFQDALTALCEVLAEASSSGRSPDNEDEKDAKVDIVVWRSFPDGRKGKLIAFGQCATGGDWRDKVSEMQPSNFAKLALAETPVVDPVRLFFTPFRIERVKWRKWGISAGVLFDRCRIVSLAGLTPDRPRSLMSRWNRSVIREHLT